MATEVDTQTEELEGLEELRELEEKIERVAAALKEARAERERAEHKLAQLQTAYDKLANGQATANAETVALRKQRQEIRQRVGRLVRTLEAAS